MAETMGNQTQSYTAPLFQKWEVAKKAAAVVIVLCSAVIFAVAYKLIYPPCSIKDIVPTAMSLIQASISKHTTFTKYTSPEEQQHNNSIKHIVLWNTYFGHDNWDITFPEGAREKEISCFGRSKCVLSINRTHPLSYDAVVFHARDHHTPPEKRSPQQVYIMYVWESPTYRSDDFIRGGGFYNWTSTYSTKSDITMKHGSFFRLPEKAPDALKRLPQMRRNKQKGEAMVAWIVSHCGGSSERFQYVDEFKKYLRVDIYGKCGKPCPGGTSGNSLNCYEQVASTGQYKFYLAFENSLCQDYISWKPFRALNSTMVPVVLGGTSTIDYFRVLPPKSYIDVRNFTSPKLLADYLKHLDGNDDEYLAYHTWRKGYWVLASFGPTFCQICDALYDRSMTRPRNIDWGEFWNGNRMCDNRLVLRLLGKG